ncbi:hypothetical protein BOTBODRAFT_106029, partial [Botryobasidium botryosum FD-172 SS1]
GLPKRYEVFIFFTIQDVAGFKKALSQVIPLITTTAQIQRFRSEIAHHKRNKGEGLLKFAGTNIGFSQTGLTKLGITDSLGDPAFTAGQLASAKALGDDGTTDASNNFTPNWLPEFKGDTHGIILIGGDSFASVNEAADKVEYILGGTIKAILKVQANARPGKEKGHEHFGYLDGISFPAIPALTGQLPGQQVVQPGVLVCGEDGDVDTTTKQPVVRPSWAVNGSFLVYRHLNQLVPEFNEFVRDNALNTTGTMTQEQGAELLGARFFGRWKSGAPIDIAPTQDNPVLAADPKRNNNFNFSGQDVLDQTRCPFSAHIRKTNPRNDLAQYVFGPTAVSQHMINRQSIAFGPEVTPQEAQTGKTIETRGLSFVCYQSNLANGFEFVQKAWADTTTFPPKTINGAQFDPGFDPIIGQANGAPRQVAGMDPNNQSKNLTLPSHFVASKGGQYFFSPSITALKTKFAA